jgi:hypothetical protein
MELDAMPEPEATPPPDFFRPGDRVVVRATGAKATVHAVNGTAVHIQYDGARGRRGAWHAVNAESIRHED